MDREKLRPQDFTTDKFVVPGTKPGYLELVLQTYKILLKLAKQEVNY